MLCRSCQNQARCLPAQFAQADPALAALLNQLQDCQLQNHQFQDCQGQDNQLQDGMKAAAYPSSFLQALWVRGQRWGRQLWQSLRRWGQWGRMGSA